MRSHSLRGVAAAILLAAFVGPASLAAARPAPTLELSGIVHDARGEPVAGATVSVGDADVSTRADDAGRFTLFLPRGSHLLRAVAPGYEEAQVSVSLDADRADVRLVLEPLLQLRENVVVLAIRADTETPVTKTDIDRSRIERLNYGQEMPVLLAQAAPSITSYSDGGAGSGYSYFQVRGIQQTRINFTLDGAPLNDPEESALYFSNFGDFASAVGSIQIQRGVGASTVGAAAFGGSVNFTSVDFDQKRGLGALAGAGSFGSWRTSLSGQSGELPGGYALYGRASTPGDRRLPGALGGEAARALLRRLAAGQSLVLQALRILGSGAHGAVVPRIRGERSRGEPARQPALSRRARPVRAELPQRAVHPLPRPVLDPRRPGLLQRREGVVSRAGCLLHRPSSSSTVSTAGSWAPWSPGATTAGRWD